MKKRDERKRSLRVGPPAPPRAKGELGVRLHETQDDGDAAGPDAAVTESDPGAASARRPVSRGEPASVPTTIQISSPSSVPTTSCDTVKANHTEIQRKRTRSRDMRAQIRNRAAGSEKKRRRKTGPPGRRRFPLVSEPPRRTPPCHASNLGGHPCALRRDRRHGRGLSRQLPRVVRDLPHRASGKGAPFLPGTRRRDSFSPCWRRS